jgi:hypothetical protein
LTVVKLAMAVPPISDAEHAEGEALAGRRVPAGDQRHTDGEGGATEAEEEPGDDERRIGGHDGQGEHRHDGGEG